MSKIDLTQANEAAQDNALLNILAAACQTSGWLVFVHNNGETVDVIAGENTPELRAKVLAAMNDEQPAEDMEESDEDDRPELPFGHPGPGYDDTPPEVYEELYPYKDSVLAKITLGNDADDSDTEPFYDEEAEAEQEAIEAQRQADHDEAIANDTTEGDLFYYPDPMEHER